MSKKESPSKARLVTPENTLKKKVGFGGFAPAALITAQAAIENNTVDFRPLATELNSEVAKVIESIKASSCHDPSLLNELMYPLMQLKAQGSLFHYPLITKISHILLDLLENISGLDSIIVEIVEAYKNTISVIVALQIKDETSKQGQAICFEFTEVCNRYFKLKDIG